MSNEAMCINLEYEPNNDMVIWTLRFLHEGGPRSIASPAASFAEAVGINGKISKDEWELFCKQMKNKKVNFVLPEEK